MWSNHTNCWECQNDGFLWIPQNKYESKDHKRRIKATPCNECNQMKKITTNTATPATTSDGTGTTNTMANPPSRKDEQ